MHIWSTNDENFTKIGWILIEKMAAMFPMKHNQKTWSSDFWCPRRMLDHVLKLVKSLAPKTFSSLRP